MAGSPRPFVKLAQSSNEEPSFTATQIGDGEYQAWVQVYSPVVLPEWNLGTATISPSDGNPYQVDWEAGGEHEVIIAFSGETEVINLRGRTLTITAWTEGGTGNPIPGIDLPLVLVIQ